EHACIRELSPYVDVVVSEASVDAMMDIYASSLFSIGERLHANVLSAAAGTPFISLGYRPKCYDFAESLQYEMFYVQLDMATMPLLSTMVDRLIDRYDRQRRKLAENVACYRALLREKAEYVMNEVQHGIS
ncbi:MAG: polysaccharide pyruvyl transferase family protein, partial [Thermoplasmatota archaeon]